MGMLWALALGGFLIFGDQAEPADCGDDAPSPAEAKSAAVEKGPFRVLVPIEGYLVAGEAEEIALRPEEWKELTVLRAVPHGSKVDKGDEILVLDSTKLDEAIRELESSRALAELSIRQAEDEIRLMEKTLPFDLAQAEWTRKNAEEDLRNFLDVVRPFAERKAEQDVKSAADYLSYVEEELRQLERMYFADDLTEETEEIVLKRQRDEVERTRFRLESAKLSSSQETTIRLPREDVQKRRAAESAAQADEKAKVVLPIALQKRRLQLDQEQYQFTKSTERLERLRRDRALLTVRAPLAGIVAHGRSVRGQWTTAAAMGDKLMPGGSLGVGEIAMTIVRDKPVAIAGQVEEGSLNLLGGKPEGKSAAVAFPRITFPVRLESISSLPVGGKLDARLSITLPDSPQLRPGMATKGHLVSYEVNEAILVPNESIFRDESDPETRYVYLPAKADSSPEKRIVQVGHSFAGKTEILEGLDGSERVLLEKPKP